MGKIIAFTRDGTKTKVISVDGGSSVLGKRFEDVELSVSYHTIPENAANIFFNEIDEGGVRRAWLKPDGYPIKVSDEVMVVRKSPKGRNL